MTKVIYRKENEGWLISAATTVLLLVSLSTAGTVGPFEHLGSDLGVDRVRFQLDECTIQSAGEFIKISSSGSGTTSQYGLPELPAFSTMYQIDPEKLYQVDFTVVESHVLENVTIFPHQRPRSEEDFQYNNAFYSSVTPFPAENLTVSEPQIMRGMYLINVRVVPFIYHPNENRLEVFDEIEITVEEIGESGITDYDSMPRSRAFETLYEQLVVNYVEPSDEKFQQPSILYICGGSSESNSYFQDLVEWRHQRGYKVYTASLDETGSTANDIKDYIYYAYSRYNPPPEHVAFVGDVGGSYSVPTFYEGWGHNSYNNQCEGDQPYAELAGGDLLPEVFVGRISIRSTSHLSTIVNKIISYEKAEYLEDIQGYYERAALIGDPSSSGISTVITNEYIEEVLDAYGMDDIRTKYSGSSWSSWMRNQLSDGVLYFNYRGYVGVSGFGNSDVSAANNGFMLTFATVITCGTGSFAEDNTALSEQFIRAGTASTPEGGVAAVGTATWNTHTLFNNIVDMGIYDGLFVKGLETAGAGLANGKLALLAAYPTNPYDWVSAFTQWNNLMGDPATHLWTDTPSLLMVEHTDAVYLGTNFMDVIVSSNPYQPIEGAMVSVVSSDGELQKVGYTDELGEVTLIFDQLVESDMIITVTKRNWKPYQGTISLLTGDVMVNFDGTSDIAVNDEMGNTDGLVNPGETIGLSIPLKNFGSESATGVIAHLTSGSELITVLDSAVVYGEITPGESVYGEQFTIVLLPSVIQHEDLDLRLDISDDLGNVWQSTIPVEVSGSLLQIYSLDIANPGETTELTMKLRNNGETECGDVFVNLSYHGELLGIIDSVGTFGSIPPGEYVSSQDGFVVTTSEDVINGTMIPLNVHIQSTEGYDQTEVYHLQAGEVTVEDPLGPDEYGYYIYDIGDISYDLAPFYDWIEIDPGHGGNGTDLNLSDNGNGNYSTSIKHVDLPFVFRFYGVDYDEITVCSNGWIALGYSTMESFRNYPIPGPGGPSPMIGAFWDDLKTTNGGDVFGYEDPGGEYIIIEWSDMRTQNNNHLESFQVILYNIAVPPYGDGEIKLQYKEFNNTSSGNFGGYPPVHGGYATIGIEDHLAAWGLQYTFNNEYPTAAKTLADETALFITTRSSSYLPMPELVYSPESVEMVVEIGGTTSSEVIISNEGDEGSTLNYTIEKAPAPPFDVSAGGPDTFGYEWSDSETDPSLGYDWINIPMTNEVTFTHNDIASGPFDLGFDFPFYGEIYTQCIINPNGWVGFGDDWANWQNTSIPDPDAPRPAVLGFWDDLDPLQGGSVYYYNLSDKFVVWFNDVIHYPGSIEGTYNFQIVLHTDGEVQVNYQSVSGNTSSQTIGVQNASGTVGLQVVHNDDYVEDNLSLHFRFPKPIDWMTLTGELNGNLLFGESAVIGVEADATDLQLGSYGGLLNITSNFQPLETIPVNLTVTGYLPPVAVDDYYTVSEDDTLAMEAVEGVLANDSNSNGDTLTVELVSDVGSGHLLLEADGSFIYIPYSNFFGEDSFSYIASDDSMQSDIAIVTIAVEPVNDPPGDFEVLAPALDTIIVITPENLSESLTIQWSESENVDEDEILYSLSNVEGLDFLEELGEIDSTELVISYEELAALMGEDMASGYWNVSADDGEFVISAGNGPFALTIDKTSLSVNGVVIPTEYFLHQNYPNPFNPVTTIVFDLPEAVDVRIEIFNVLGQRIRTLVNRPHQPGSYRLQWDGKSDSRRAVTSGMYICRIQAGDYIQERKLLLMK